MDGDAAAATGGEATGSEVTGEGPAAGDAEGAAAGLPPLPGERHLSAPGEIARLMPVSVTEGVGDAAADTGPAPDAGAAAVVGDGEGAGDAELAGVAGDAGVCRDGDAGPDCHSVRPGAGGLLGAAEALAEVGATGLLAARGAGEAGVTGESELLADAGDAGSASGAAARRARRGRSSEGSGPLPGGGAAARRGRGVSGTCSSTSAPSSSAFRSDTS